ncbi:PTS beta-glucoside transporter subunit EIIBCA, partial [Bacillus cereus]
TVDLGGAPFEVKVTEGQLVTPDTLVAQVDLAAIKAAGKETSMMVLITNMEKVKNFVLEKTGETKAKAKVMTVEATKN